MNKIPSFYSIDKMTPFAAHMFIPMASQTAFCIRIAFAKLRNV